MKSPTEKLATVFWTHTIKKQYTVCEDCDGAGEIEYLSTQWQSRAAGEPYLEWGECETCHGHGHIETDLTED
jgi:DnaJ-class molecular chaperone